MNYFAHCAKLIGMAHTLTAAQVQYQHYLQSPRWRLIRFLRLHLDGKRCRVCNSRERLEVHHRSYKHRGGSLEGELRDTITLCSVCHDNAHERGLSK